MQGAGGMRFHDPEVLRRLRRLADRFDLLLIFDEIFTGFGRTGTMFACESAGVMPDIVTLSKALTGGTLPLAATVATSRHLRELLVGRSDGSADARADLYGECACLRRRQCVARPVRGRRAAGVRWRRIERWLADGLASCRDLPGVTDVRMRGAIGVVELERIDDLNALRSAFVAKGAFIRPIGNVIYLAPALTIGEEDVAFLTRAIGEVLKNVQQTEALCPGRGAA